MTRDQDFERRLADWLADGPSLAPVAVVEQALERTTRRRQQRGAWRRLTVPLGRVGHWLPTNRVARVTALAAVLSGVVLAGSLVSFPFGGAGPAPEMDASAIRTISGTAQLSSESEGLTELARLVDVRTGDPRVDGRARQELAVLLDTDAGLNRSRGTMRLENDWGAWEGPVDLVIYPSGEEWELASLTGSGAYEGFTYLYTSRHFLSQAERTVEGAIWPDEPPSVPDPSLLP